MNTRFRACAVGVGSCNQHSVDERVNSLVAVDGSGSISQTFVENRVGVDALASLSLAEAFSIVFNVVAGDEFVYATALGYRYGVPTVRVFFGVRFSPTEHDSDHDGIADSKDQCPTYAEDRDGIEDGDGCPEEDPDADQDGVPDVDDECPDDKETINGHDDDDGCPDSGDPRVTFEDGKFHIEDTIQFETGSAQIKPESHSLLDQVALTMKANPQIKRIRVEGHSDDTGTRELNMRLSKERARAVRGYLVDKGVSPQRLSSQGYGPDRPLVEGTSEEARARNRRVEFVVE